MSKENIHSVVTETKRKKKRKIKKERKKKIQKNREVT